MQFPLLERIAVVSLAAAVVFPALAELSDSMAAQPRPTPWQITLAVSWDLARGALMVAALLLVIGWGVRRVVTFRPGNRVRVVRGPWAGAEGRVADGHDPENLGGVLVVLKAGGVERQEKLSCYDVEKRWWFA